MSSNKESAVRKGVKRKHTGFDEITNDPSSPLTTTEHLNDSSITSETASDLLTKYQNLSREELADFCERWMLYDSTGIYVSQSQFKSSYQKMESKISPLPLVETERNNQSTSYGKGHIGLATTHFGNKNCFCCNPINYTQTFNIPSGNVIEKCNASCNSHNSSNMNDYATPSCSGVQNGGFRRDPLPLPLFTNQVVDDIINSAEYSYPDPESALDLSPRKMAEKEQTRDILNISDLSPTIRATAESISSTDGSVVNLSGISVKTESETVQDEAGSDGFFEAVNNATDVHEVSCEIISVAERTENIEIVDLTAISFFPPRLPVRHFDSTEVIELLDDTAPLNTTPAIIDTIDLVNSDSDSDNKSNRLSGRNKPTVDCPICFESLKGKKVMTTICGHVFCAGCIVNAIKSQKCCPKCRKRLRNKSIHPIYLDF